MYTFQIKRKVECVMNEKEQMIECIVKRVGELPSAAQEAIGWLIEHITLVNIITEDEGFTENEAQEYLQQALEKNDYPMLVFILYKQIKDKQEAEELQQELIQL
jgi:hypothetical protein